MNVAGRTAVVTGAAKGIGFAIAACLGRAGARIVISDINEAGLSAASETLAKADIPVIAHRCDVTDPVSVVELVDVAIATFGSVDIMVNNAGVGLGGPFDRIPLDDWRWIIDINLLGVVNGVQAALPHMRRQGNGHIVNIASSVALFADAPQAVPYVTTKAAVLGMSRALARSLGREHIGVTVLCPDNTDTGFRTTARVVGIDRSTVVASLPPNAMQAADEVADALLDGLRHDRFLVSLSAEAEHRMHADVDAMFADGSALNQAD